jgi:HK97 family phage prohead protease
MLLRKTNPLASVMLKISGDSGQFEGYASVFNVMDDQGDIILPGAYKKTLADSGLPKMFFDHKWSMPVGLYKDAAEDQTGLYVKGELTPGHSLANDVHAAMKHGTLDGLSVGGMVKKADYEVKSDARYIKSWTRLMEVSPVAFPSNPEARIDLDSVKGADLIDAIEEIETVREFESFLRDAGSLSKGAVAALTARMKVVFGRGEPEQEHAEVKALAEIAQRISRRAGLVMP